MDSTAETGTKTEIPEGSLISMEPWSNPMFAHAERRLLEAYQRVYVLIALYDGLPVRRTGFTLCPTDWKSVVRAVRRTSSPSHPKIALYDSTR